MTPSRYVTSLIEAFDRYADRPAVIFGDDELSYAEFRDTAYRIARALRELGVERGTGVTWVSGNRPELLLTRLAAHLLGARFTAVVLDSDAHGIEHILRDSEPTVIVLENPSPAAVAVPVLSVERLMALAAVQAVVPVAVTARETDIARVMYTSGTTGLPKGVASTFGAMAARAPRDDNQAAARTFLSVTSLATRAGGRCFEQFLTGGRVEILPDFSIPDFVAACARSAPAATYLIPHQIYELLDHPLSRDGVPGLESVAYGASAIAPSRLQEALLRFGAAEFRQGYGMTESAVISRLTPADHRAGVADRPQLLASAGRPVPGVTVEIQAPDGSDLPHGQVGEVCVRSEAVFAGYWRRNDLTATVIRDGWLHTGDLGRFDDDGYLYLVDRLADLIMVDGHKSYAAPIEAVLSRDPAVAAAAVVGYERLPGVEEIHAFLVPVPEYSGTPELAARACAPVAAELAEASKPTTVRWLPKLPLVATGKVDKKRLRAIVAAEGRTASGP